MAATSGVFLLMSVIILVVAPPSRAFFLPQWYSDEEVSAEYDQPDLEEIPQGAASLAFVFDITGSMHDDLVQVIHGAARILATTLARRDKPLFNYVLVPFHDPGQYSQTVANTVTEIAPVNITTQNLPFLRPFHSLRPRYTGRSDGPSDRLGRPQDFFSGVGKLWVWGRNTPAGPGIEPRWGSGRLCPDKSATGCENNA